MIRPVGRLALLADADDPAAAAEQLRRGGLHLRDVVPGATTVLAVVAEPADLPALAGALERAAHASRTAPTGPTIEVPVRYDGPDLEAVAAATGLDADGVVAAHAGAGYRGAFGGFAPGFCYLTGLPEVLHLRRRPEPRALVTPGAVAIADRYSAVYPRATPGGWHLIGSTDVTVWDSARVPPALLAPGAAVRFVPQ